MSKPFRGLWKATFGEISQTLRVLENWGIAPQDLKRLRRDPAFAERLTTFWKASGELGDSIPDTPSQAKARSIMRKNFLGLKEVQRGYGVAYTNVDRLLLAEVPYKEETLEAHKKTHVLFAGSALSVRDISTIAFDVFYESDLDEDAGVSKKRVGIHWYLLRKQPVPNSYNKSPDEQLALLTKGEEVPFTCEETYMVILYWLTHRVRLLKKVYARCKDKNSHGFPLCVGYFDSDGYEINDHAYVGDFNADSFGLSGLVDFATNPDHPVGLASSLLPDLLDPVS